MRKIIITILLLSWLCGITTAQPVRFNNRYYSDGFEEAFSVIPYDNYYWIAGGAQNTNNEQIIHLIKLDSLGNQLDAKDIGKPNRMYFHGWSGASVKISENNFIIGGSYVDSLGVPSFLLLKLNNIGDTIWTKIYSFDGQNLAYDVTQTSDKGFVLAGTSYINNQYAVRIVKTDSLGTFLWTNTYANASMSYGSVLIETPDKGLCIGGFSSINGTVLKLNQLLIKTDSLGNQQWLRTYGGTQNDPANAYVINTNDGQLAFCSSYTDNEDGAGNLYGSFYIAKVNIVNGDTLWLRKYGNGLQIDQVLYSMVELNDGSLVAVGKSYENGFQKQYGVLIKVAADGNEIWTRYYQAPGNTQNFNTNSLYDLQSTQDSGFIMCGYMVPESGDGNKDFWVVKVDKYGCVEEGCQLVGIEEPDNDNFRLFIYPNPAQNFVTVKLPINYNKGNLQIINMLGQVVKNIALSGNGSQTIETTDLPSGIYQLLVYSNNKSIIGNEKLIIVTP